MDVFGFDGKFESASQRVAATYQRMLAAFCPVNGDSLTVEQQASLHGFFATLYAALFSAPVSFGLPVVEDIFLLSDPGKAGPNKTEVKRVLDKPRKIIEDGLEFLRQAGLTGRMDASGQALVIEPHSPAMELLKKKTGRAWIKGLESAGLSLNDAGGPLLLESVRFPAMLPALQALAQASASCENPDLGRIFFARCDLRALSGDFRVDALELFHTLPAEDCDRAIEMHAFFTGRGYQPAVILEHIHQWDVTYQGKRSMKASPLFKIIFDERLLHQMRAQIKIASLPRVAPRIADYSTPLQEDLSRRTYPCKDCGWCKNGTGLHHPMLFPYQGQEQKRCWYINPDVDALTPDAVALVKEWTALHETLAA